MDSRHGNLLYYDENNFIHKYLYKTGETIILGDGFLHSTEPYSPTDNLRVLLSLTFGTDKLTYWDTLKKTVGDQSRFLILPCGHQSGTCKCLQPEINRNSPCYCGPGEKYKKCHGPLDNKPI